MPSDDIICFRNITTTEKVKFTANVVGNVWCSSVQITNLCVYCICTWNVVIIRFHYSAGVMYKTKEHLVDHERSDCGKTPHLICEICGKHFSFRTFLCRHMRKHAGTAKTHECETCGKIFTKKNVWRLHMTIHTGEKPFLCSVYAASFRNKTVLKDHELRHKGIKPHKCIGCGDRFSCRKLLQKHRIDCAKTYAVMNAERQTSITEASLVWKTERKSSRLVESRWNAPKWTQHV